MPTNWSSTLVLLVTSVAAAAVLVGIYLLRAQLSTPVAIILIVAVVTCTTFCVHYFEHRRAEQLSRRETIYKVHLMLEDVVRNHLSVIQMNAFFLADAENKRVRRIEDAVQSITKEVDGLSDVSLEQWEAKYHHVINATFAADPQK